ncbi:hypothetical protein HW932_06725 [Allochromatium humboldtianum]|uniref:Uncharacterized protein n=1 Tax=Allochromatium humboldtianum TaxID=504901 RepID=A0A850RIV8_9GAMM|nr:hypothetical protein [Allochromatium humboldtianum]NVZ08953.1 hypothetical protein [Allochromatium humboldtianum]
MGFSRLGAMTVVPDPASRNIGSITLFMHDMRSSLLRAIDERFMIRADKRMGPNGPEITTTVKA